MSKLFIKILILSFILLGTFFMILWMRPEQNQELSIVGDNVFFDTDKADKIVIATNENTSVFYKRNGIWVNDDGYYINNNMMYDFLYALKNSFYLSRITMDGSFFDTGIALFRGENELVKFSYFYEPEEDENLIMNDGVVYKINKHFNLPQKNEYWFVQPLIQLDNNHISEVINLEIDLSFDDLIFYKAVKKDSVELDVPKSFQFVLDNGLVISFNMYKLSENYWVEVVLSKTIMTTQEAANYLKYNSPLYEGWIFMLSNEVGAAVYNGIINPDYSISASWSR